MLKHYVEFYYPGSFFPETEIREIASRKTKVAAPENCYGYRLFDREEVMQGKERLAGNAKNFSGMTFFGQTMTVADVAKLAGDHSILISNMRCNKWKKVVKTRRGNFQPVQKGDTVIAA
jgi:hypothetical protein